MKSGDVYAWWPFGKTFKDQYRKATIKLDRDESIVPEGGTVMPCHTWEIKKDPVKLPILPDLPDLLETGLSEEECRKDTKLIKIAAFNTCLIGLTNKGHVLKMDKLDAENSTLVWDYVSESV